LGAPGVDLDQAVRLVADVARLAGVSPSDLVGPTVGGAGDRTILHWDRSWRGAPVEGDRVSIVAIDGTISGVWVQLTPIPARIIPRAGEVIFVDSVRGRPTPAVREQQGTHVVYLSRQGQELFRYETRRPARVNITLEARTIDDPLIEVPARQVRVGDIEGESVLTDDAGDWSGIEASGLEFRGPVLRISDEDGLVSVPAPTTMVDPWVVNGGEDVPLSVGTVLHHTHVAWDWLAARWPTHPWLDDRMQAKVRESSDVCNAWYDGTSITFCQEEEGRCHDFGRIADVVYHELGHGVHHRILATGTFAGDISEGSADFFSATITGDPVLAPNATPGGGYVREIATDRSYPDDFVEEVHNDGLIWASFLWNLRSDWVDEMGEAAGLDAVDGLFLRALEQGPSLLDSFEAVLVADDDDGDLSNGTPHDCELMERLNDHGIGPGPIGVVTFDHTPLSHQGSSVLGYSVEFELQEITEDCGDLDLDSVAIWYATTDVAVPGVVLPAELGDTGWATPVEEDPYAEWSRVVPESDGIHWGGVIPRQPAAVQVRYFIEAASTDGTQVVQTHGGYSDGVYSFWVGDQREIWCDDFEDGGGAWTHGVGSPESLGSTEDSSTWSSEWGFGVPSASTWGPDAAPSGTLVAATALGAEYRPNNVQYLRSPTVDLSGAGPMLSLRFKRWLTVEDGLYDQAQIWSGVDQLWHNPTTAGGMNHVLDEAWTEQVIGLSEPSSSPGETYFTWSLRTDPGLEFGGWHLDDVCVVELDDAAGHYTVRDLTATTGAPSISLAWTQPWITPLGQTIVVRSEGVPPEGPDDGVIVDLRVEPTPGEEVRITDTDVILDTLYFYAVFASGADSDSFYATLVLDQNLVEAWATMMIPDTGAPDTGVPAGEETGVPDDGTSASEDTGGSEETGSFEGETSGESRDSGESSAGGPRPYMPPTVTKGGCACGVGGAALRGFGLWWWSLLLCFPAVRRR
jgi:hypothetical protein